MIKKSNCWTSICEEISGTKMIETIDRRGAPTYTWHQHRASTPKYGSVSKDPKIDGCKSGLHLKTMLVEIGLILLEILTVCVDGKFILLRNSILH